jgi:endonuclease III
VSSSTVRAVLDRYGTTLAAEAGLRLANRPAALFQLLVLSDLVAARIPSTVAVATAGELRAHGWTTPRRLAEAPQQQLLAALGRGGYRRYDLRTAALLPELARAVLDRYGGDLRRLGAAADQDVVRTAALLREFPGIGPTGAAVFLREVQAVWPWVRPYLDDRSRAGARRIGLPDDAESLASLAGGNDIARLVSGLARVSRVRDGEDALRV